MVRLTFPPYFRESARPDSYPAADVVAIVEEDWEVGDLVDWWSDGCFWSGRVTQILGNDRVEIKLPDPPIGEGKVYEAFCKDFRPSLNWSAQHGWTVPISREYGSSQYCARLVQPLKQENVYSLNQQIRSFTREGSRKHFSKEDYITNHSFAHSLTIPANMEDGQQSSTQVSSHSQPRDLTVRQIKRKIRSQQNYGTPNNVHESRKQQHDHIIVDKEVNGNDKRQKVQQYKSRRIIPSIINATIEATNEHQTTLLEGEPVHLHVLPRRIKRKIRNQQNYGTPNNVHESRKQQHDHIIVDKEVNGNYKRQKVQQYKSRRIIPSIINVTIEATNEQQTNEETEGDALVRNSTEGNDTAAHLKSDGVAEENYSCEPSTSHAERKDESVPPRSLSRAGRYASSNFQEKLHGRQSKYMASRRHSDTVESAVMELEEVANKIRWLKGLLQFGFGWCNAMKPSWKILENSGQHVHR